MSTDYFLKASKYYDDGYYEEAFKIFLQLAENGDVSAMTRVACIYGDDKRGFYDIEKSIFWDLKAIEFGSETALFNLGITYRNIRDYKNAKKWFEKSFQRGDGDAAIELAKILLATNPKSKKIKFYLQQALNSKNIFDDSEIEARCLLDELDNALEDER